MDETGVDAARQRHPDRGLGAGEGLGQVRQFPPTRRELARERVRQVAVAIAANVVAPPTVLRDLTSGSSGRRPRATGLVDEDRCEPGERSRLQPVEQTGPESLGDQQVGLVVEPGQHGARRSERPAVHVAHRLEQAKDPVELVRQRMLAIDRGRVDPGQLRTQSVGVAGGDKVRSQFRTALHRMLGGASDPFVAVSAAVRRSLADSGGSRDHLAERPGGLLLEGPTVGLERHRELHVRHDLRDGTEVRRGEREHAGIRGQRAQRRVSSPSLRGGNHHRPTISGPGVADRRGIVAATDWSDDVARSHAVENGRDLSFVDVAGGTLLLSGSAVRRNVAVDTGDAFVGLDQFSAQPVMTSLLHNERGVDLELGEGEREKMVGVLALIATNHVHGHVGRRSKCRTELVGALRREVGHLIKGGVRREEGRCVAHRVDAPSAGSAGELGVLPRREHLVALARELGQFFDHDRACRHVDAQRQRFRGEDDLHQSFEEARLDGFLEGRNESGMVRGEAVLETAQESLVVEHPQIIRAQ